MNMRKLLRATDVEGSEWMRESAQVYNKRDVALAQNGWSVVNRTLSAFPLTSKIGAISSIIKGVTNVVFGCILSPDTTTRMRYGFAVGGKDLALGAATLLSPPGIDAIINMAVGARDALDVVNNLSPTSEREA